MFNQVDVYKEKIFITSFLSIFYDFRGKTESNICSYNFLQLSCGLKLPKSKNKYFGSIILKKLHFAPH